MWDRVGARYFASGLPMRWKHTSTVCFSSSSSGPCTTECAYGCNRFFHEKKVGLGPYVLISFMAVMPSVDLGKPALRSLPYTVGNT